MPAFAAEPADRGDVQHDAAVVLHPGLPRGLGPYERSAEVDLERLVVAAEVDVDARPEVGVGRGVVDEDVEATGRCIDGGLDAGLGLVGVAGVGGEGHDVDRGPHRRGGLVERLGLAGREHDVGAGGGECRGDRPRRCPRRRRSRARSCRRGCRSVMHGILSVGGRRRPGRRRSGRRRAPRGGAGRRPRRRRGGGAARVGAHHDRGAGAGDRVRASGPGSSAASSGCRAA